jgi:Sec-independent protein translocase protein TatA
MFGLGMTETIIILAVVAVLLFFFWRKKSGDKITSQGKGTK